MLVVELFDVQEELFDSPELLPVSRLRATISFSIYIAGLKGTINFFIKQRSQTHASVSQRFVTTNSL